MTLENPLQVPLILQNVQLQARYHRHDIVVQKDPATDGQSVSLRPTTSDAAGAGKDGWSLPETAAGRTPGQPFTVDALEQVVMNPGERAQVCVCVCRRARPTIASASGNNCLT